MIATGTRLIAKIQRHDAWSTIRPPASGPAMTAIPPQAVHDPIAAPRSRSENAAAMIASELGVRSAPATPCAARAAISVSTFGAAAQASDSKPKPPTPSSNTRRLP